MSPGNPVDPTTVITIEALADTVIPGEQRFPGDRAIAGAAPGPGAVQAGALEVLQLPATGLGEALPDLARMLNDHATARIQEYDLPVDESIPAFVGLDFEHRTALVQQLTAVGHPEKDGWVGLVMFATMAYDSAPHLHTVDALAAGHPGLTAMGFALPQEDGLWRFDEYSYGRPLARLHPTTTSSGSPA